MAIFLVNQGQTYKHERAGSYIWSPKLNKAGQMILLTAQGLLVCEVHEHTRMVLERIVIHSKTHFTVRFLDGTSKEVCLTE